jgi:hypothetical protein
MGRHKRDQGQLFYCFNLRRSFLGIIRSGGLRRAWICSALLPACIRAGLVGGEGFAVDASLIEADANKGRSIPGSEWTKDIDPTRAGRAVKEYLATLDDAAYGAATEVVPKFVSPSDPAAQWTGAMKGAAFFAYADNYLIDVKFGIIMDVEVSRAVRQAEVGASRTMIERTGGPILFLGTKAMTQAGTPPPRTVIGEPSQADGLGRNCPVSSVTSVHCAARRTTPSGQSLGA